MLAVGENLSPELSEVSFASSNRNSHTKIPSSRNWASLLRFPRDEVLKRLPKEGTRFTSRETFDYLIEDLAQENIKLREENSRLSSDCMSRAKITSELENQLETACRRIQELEIKFKNSQAAYEENLASDRSQSQMPRHNDPKVVESRTPTQELTETLISRPIDIQKIQDIFYRREMVGRHQPGVVLECLDLIDHMSSQEREGSERRLMLDAARKTAKGFLPKY